MLWTSQEQGTFRFAGVLCDTCMLLVWIVSEKKSSLQLEGLCMSVGSVRLSRSIPHIWRQPICLLAFFCPIPGLPNIVAGLQLPSPWLQSCCA